MNAGPGAPLIFDWPRRKRFSLVLFGFVAASLLAHAATFFLFQVVYPQHVSIPSVSPRVSLLTPSSPENIALLRWIESEDPALGAGGPITNPAAVVDVPYRPSYSIPRTAPLSPPAEKPEPVAFPPGRDALAMIAGASDRSPRLRPPSPPRLTAVAFSGILGSRAVEPGPPLAFTAPASVELQPSRWLIGVDGSGQVRYVFIEESCGDPALDSLASRHLEHLRFAPAESSMLWGFATISWGDDAYGVHLPEKASTPDSK